MTLPIKDILNRETTDELIKVINEFIPIIEECVNYGTQILYADRKPKTDGDENLAPIMLLRHYLETLDAISILIGKGSADSSKILLRALFETMLFIEFLFEKNTNIRAYSYLVADIRRQIKAAKTFSPDRVESNSFYNTLKKEGFSISPDDTQIQEIKDFITIKESVLNSPHLAKINSEFEKLKRKGIRSPAWYSLDNGPKNIESLSTHLEQKTIYEILYRKWSGAVHSTDVYLGKILHGETEDQINIVQLRYVKDLPEVVLYATLFSFKVLRIYITNRLPEKVDEYAKWYLNSIVFFRKLKSIRLKVV